MTNNSDFNPILRDVSGISTVLDLTSTMKGVSPGPVEFGLALDKTGIQLGITGTATLAGEVSGTKIRVGYAPCPAGNVMVRYIY